MRADREERFFALEFKILRLESDRSKGKEPVVIPNGCRAFNNHVRLEVAALADPDAVSDATVRPDMRVSTDLRFRADDRGRMNHGC